MNRAAGRAAARIGGAVRGVMVMLAVVMSGTAGAASASAAEKAASVYAVDKVALDVSADNAVLAKEIALREGPLKALQVMFRRLAPFRAYAHLPTLTQKDAEAVLDGFSLRSERNSQTRYLALVDYSFSRQKLDALLTRRGIPFYAGRSGPQTVLVVPGGPVAADMESWWQAWREVDIRHGLTDSRLLRGKPADIEAWQKIAAGDSAAYAPIAQRYDGQSVILVSAAMDEVREKLTLRLFGQDQAGPINYSQQLPVAGAPEAAMRVAALITHGIIEGRWREPKIEGDVVAPSSEGGQVEQVSLGAKLVEETVFMRVTFNGLRDWQQIRNRLQRLPGVRDLQVNSLSPHGADVRLAYPGGLGRLEAQLSSAGFAIDRQGGDLVLRSLR